jgi:hypothetical protein
MSYNGIDVTCSFTWVIVRSHGYDSAPSINIKITASVFKNNVRSVGSIWVQALGSKMGAVLGCTLPLATQLEVSRSPVIQMPGFHPRLTSRVDMRLIRLSISSGGKFPGGTEQWNTKLATWTRRCDAVRKYPSFLLLFISGLVARRP